MSHFVNLKNWTYPTSSYYTVLIMKKPSLLFIITQGQWGGAQRSVFDLATHLREEFNVTVAVGDPQAPQDLQEKLRSEGIPIIQLQHLVRPLSFLNDFKALREIQHLYQTLKPDIVHLHSSKAGVIGALAVQANETKPKIVYTVHGWVFLEPLGAIKKSLYTFLESFSSQKKHSIICLSKNDEQIGIQKLHIPREKLTVIPNGIDIPPFFSREEARKKILPQLSEIDFVIGCIANFYKTKGHDILLEAFTQFQKNKQNVHLALVGDGPERKNIERIIEQKNLTHTVHLIGHKKNSAEYLKAFDVFTLASVKEGMPYTILEAMSAQVPVISTNVGGISEIITDQHTGLLLRPHSSGDLAQKFEFAFSEPEKMKAFAQNAFNEKEKFSLQNMVTETKNLYLSLLTSAEGRAQSHE